MTSRTAVSVLGLGPMGRALAGALQDAGHPTTVWNRTAARADELVSRGATLAATPAEAVAASPLVITCVRDDGAVRAVLEPAAAVLHGRAVVELTSGTPEQARRRASWLTGLGADHLEGAVLTPTPSIGTPTALVLYSGPLEVYEAHRPTLDDLGGRAVHLGAEPGLAAAYDMALLDVFWNAVNGIVHGLALARAEGIPGATLAPYAQGVFGLLPEMMTRFAHQVDSGRFPGERSTIASAAAGLGHLRTAAEAHGLDTGVLAASETVARRAVAAGHGDDGLARLVDTLTRC